MSETETIENPADAAVARHKAQGAELRLKILLIGIRFEVKNPGMRLTAKVAKCSTLLRKEFGLRGKPEQLLLQYETLLTKHGLSVEA